MSKRQYFLASAVLIFIFCSSCKKDNEAVPALEVPAQYDGKAFTANATSQLAALSQMEKLMDAIENAENPSVELSHADLVAVFNEGNRLPALTVTGLKDQLIGPGGLLKQTADASGGVWTPVDSVSEGGVYGAYLFNGRGQDMPEMVEKSLFGGLIYYHAVELLSGINSLAATDKALAIIGANPAFPNTSTPSELVSQPDVLLAKYISRRDKNDGNGMYSRLAFQFRKLQAALKKAPAYEQDRSQAVAEIKLILEKAMAASIVNYCKSAQSSLSKTTLSDADKSAALHSLSEGIGFALGLAGVPQESRKISNSQLSQILAFFNHQPGDAKTFWFALRPFEELPKLQSAIALIQSVYGFSDSEIQDFGKNWISEQGR